jgi:hypothetical protein
MTVILCSYLMLSLILTNSRLAWSDDVAPIGKRRVWHLELRRPGRMLSPLSFQEPRKPSFADDSFDEADLMKLSTQYVLYARIHTYSTDMCHR